MSEIRTLEQKLIFKRIANDTLNLQINDNEMLMSIVGQFDQNLRVFLNLLVQIYILEVTPLPVKEEKKILKCFHKR